jgi:phosphopantothenoylcysteine decarboxylase/phosphopantothenate--cysteine ligase
MSVLRDKKVLLIITGSIAAYKAAFLTRLLVKKGAEVRIVMTEAAQFFITPLTLSTLSQHKVLVDMMEEGEWNSHVDLGLWSDVVLVAPATANTIAKMAVGLADNLALTAYLSAKCPVVVAPAMDLDMWKHPATQKNIGQLMEYGHEIIPVEKGELASGLEGEGRMAEPEHIVQFLQKFFSKKKASKLNGKKVLITAGPTYEAIDPVRFIGNHSSGKMGVALAQSCLQKGANVELVLGPSQVRVEPGIQVHHVVSAAEMAEKAFDIASDSDVIILAAAVADYTPDSSSEFKIKKGEGDWALALKRTTDIAQHLGKVKKEGQIIIGFALETDHALENAAKKLHKKNFDFIVLNTLEDQGAGFQHSTNKITILSRDNKKLEFELKSKTEVAEDITSQIEMLIEADH